MTKKELIDIMSDYPDDTYVTIDLDDLHDIEAETISWWRLPSDGTDAVRMHEIRLSIKPQDNDQERTTATAD